MLGADVFGLVSSVAGLVAAVVSLVHWLSPWRRLRVLDTTMDKAFRTLSTLEEEHVVVDCTIVLRAQERLHWCVGIRGFFYSVCPDTEYARARLKATSFRERLVRVDSLWSAALATFSPLPIEIAQVNRQVQKVLDQLQVSIRFFMLQDDSWLTWCASRFSSSTSSTSCFVCQPYRCSGILLAEVCIAFEFNHEAGARKQMHMYAGSRTCVMSLKLSIYLSQFCGASAKLHELRTACSGLQWIIES
jgi:hypothetical protein